MLRPVFRRTTRLSIIQRLVLQRTVSSSSSSPPPRNEKHITDESFEYDDDLEIPQTLIDELEAKLSPPTHNHPLDPTLLPLKPSEPLNPWKSPFSEQTYAMSLVHGRSVHEPFLHPATLAIPVASIHFRSHHTPYLNLFTHFALHAASSLAIPTSSVVSLPTKRTLWTVPRSPFAHKKAQENFERKVHKRVIKAWDADGEVVQRWITYLRVNALAGVGMKVTMWDRVPLGIGRARVLVEEEEDVHRVPEVIKELGNQIVQDEQIVGEVQKDLNV